MRWFGSNKKQKPGPRNKIDYSDLINLDEISYAKIDQCLRDWTKNVDRIFIARERETKSLRDICDKEGIESPLEMNADQLRGIWQKHLLKGSFDGNEEVNDLMMSHLEQTMHQGGYLYMLQSACIDVGLDKEVIFSSDKIDHQATFFIGDSGLGIVESLQVKQCNSLYDGEVVAGGGETPLMAAMGEYSIDFDGIQPKAKVIKAVLDFKDDFTRNLFEGYSSQFKENVSLNIDI